jgi:hypothetical protein
MNFFCFLFFLGWLSVSFSFQKHDTHSSLLWTHHAYKKEALNSICGVQATKELISYAKYHQNVLQKNLPPRYLISVAVEAGFADRLTGIISLFWLAFLSKHAFQIGIHDKLPSFQSAFDPVFINWIRSDFSELHESPLLYTYEGIRGNNKIRQFNSSVDLKTHSLEYLINNDKKTKQLFGESNLFQYPSSHSNVSISYVYASSNRGGTHHIYQNPYLREYFQKTLDLPPEKIFRCGYHFLFNVNAPVRELVAQHWPEMNPLTTPSTFAMAVNKSTGKPRNEFISMTPRERGGEKYSFSNVRIGIGIRVGDHAFSPEKDALTQLSRYSGTFQCAEDIETSLRGFIPSKSNLSTVWLFESESLRLRQLVQEEFGQKKILIVDAKTYYYHGDCKHKLTQGGCDPSHLSSAIQDAVAQFTLFSLCDIHIFYGNSGFHRLASLVSKSPHFIYMQPSSAQCSIRSHLTWSGVSKLECGV